MKVRFLESAEVEGTKSPFWIGANEIHECEKVVFHDETCEFGDVHLSDGNILRGLSNIAFEPMGDVIEFLKPVKGTAPASEESTENVQ